MTLKIQEPLSLKMKKVYDREVKSFVQGHTATQWQSWDMNSPAREFVHLTATQWTSKAHEPFVFTLLTQYTAKGKKAKVTVTEGAFSLLWQNKSFLKPTTRLSNLRKIYRSPQAQ